MPRVYNCPFFRWEDGMKIHCESGTVRFPTIKCKLDYARRFCAAVPGWNGCTLAQYLKQYYETKESNT